MLTQLRALCVVCGERVLHGSVTRLGYEGISFPRR